MSISIMRNCETAGNSRKSSVDPARRTNEGWRFGSFRTTAERVKAVTRTNQIYDSTPTKLMDHTPENIMNLRERNRTLEISDTFRHKPGDYFEKLRDSLENRNPVGPTMTKELVAPHLYKKAQHKIRSNVVAIVPMHTKVSMKKKVKKQNVEDDRQSPRGDDEADT